MDLPNTKLRQTDPQRLYLLLTVYLPLKYSQNKLSKMFLVTFKSIKQDWKYFKFFCTVLIKSTLNSTQIQVCIIISIKEMLKIGNGMFQFD